MKSLEDVLDASTARQYLSGLYVFQGPARVGARTWSFEIEALINLSKPRKT